MDETRAKLESELNESQMVAASNFNDLQTRMNFLEQYIFDFIENKKGSKLNLDHETESLKNLLYEEEKRLKRLLNANISSDSTFSKKCSEISSSLNLSKFFF